MSAETGGKRQVKLGKYEGTVKFLLDWYGQIALSIEEDMLCDRADINLSNCPTLRDDLLPPILSFVAEYVKPEGVTRLINAILSQPKHSAAGNSPRLFVFVSCFDIDELTASSFRDALYNNALVTHIEVVPVLVSLGTAADIAIRKHNRMLQGVAQRNKNYCNLQSELIRRSGTKFLPLAHWGIDDMGAELIADSIKKTTECKRIDLSWNKISPTGGRLLAQALQYNRSIVSLSIKGNQLDSETEHLLEMALQENRIAQFKESRANDKKWLTGLEEMQNDAATHINLGKCGIIDDQIHALTKYLETTETVEAINLAGNNITEAGLQFLYNALVNNNTVKYISLVNNYFDAWDSELYKRLQNMVTFRNAKEVPMLYRHRKLTIEDLFSIIEMKYLSNDKYGPDSWIVKKRLLDKCCADKVSLNDIPPSHLNADKVGDNAIIYTVRASAGDIPIFHQELLNYFFMRKVSADHVGLNGKTALHHACNTHSYDAIVMIVEQAPKTLHFEDDEGCTPLQCLFPVSYSYAGTMPRPETDDRVISDIAQYLIDNGADVNHQSDKKELTAAHRAVLGGYYDSFQVLLKAGARIDAAVHIDGDPVNVRDVLDVMVKPRHFNEVHRKLVSQLQFSDEIQKKYTNANDEGVIPPADIILEDSPQQPEK